MNFLTKFLPQILLYLFFEQDSFLYPFLINSFIFKNLFYIKIMLNMSNRFSGTVLNNTKNWAIRLI